MNGEQLPLTHHKIKRNRGGQKGNQNARKHGFYSATLNPAEICELWNITNFEGVDPAIAVLRLKLQSVLRHDAANRRVLREASKLLAKWYSAQYHLDEADTCYLKKFMRSMGSDVNNRHQTFHAATNPA
ncbi:MAG: hypothetical protein FJ025_03110 [Chloroflexi bacterium]|nr:hypothetical protein [Chloroflexota bacterium]